MGPRLFSRGKPSAPGAWWAGWRLQWGRGFSAAESGMRVVQGRGVCVLQWGRGFSAAESKQIPSWVSHTMKLQWGRGFSAAERADVQAYLKMALGASMGPRLFSRGKLFGFLILWQYLLRFNGAAAFQPRKAESEAKKYWIAHWLQWGRGFSAAESVISCSSYSMAWRLQWGRGFLAAESDSLFGGLGAPPQLQWGRGFSAAESRSVQLSIWEHGRLQWGRGFSAAESRVYSYLERQAKRFNGAAAFQPRKADSAIRHELEDLMLQWGRGFSAAERW